VSVAQEGRWVVGKVFIVLAASVLNCLVQMRGGSCPDPSNFRGHSVTTS